PADGGAAAAWHPVQLAGPEARDEDEPRRPPRGGARPGSTGIALQPAQPRQQPGLRPGALAAGLADRPGGARDQPAALVQPSPLSLRLAATRSLRSGALSAPTLRSEDSASRLTEQAMLSLQESLQSVEV